MSQILELHKKIKNNDISITDLISRTKNNIEINDKYNSVIRFITDYKHFNNSNSLLNGIPYAVKDNINVLHYVTTGGSKFFEDFKSPYNATVINLLNDAGAIPIVKANLDEFGLGGDGIYSAYGDVINPFDANRIAGGSSSGSAVLVAKKLVPFSLATDTGDSIRKPASFLGIFGYKPTYGLISRNGVFPYSPSIDHIGLLANSIIDISIVLDAIVKFDRNDFSSQQSNPFDFYKNLQIVNKIKNKPKIVIFKNIINFASKEIAEIFYKKIKLLEALFDIELLDFNIDLLSLIPVIYKIISYSEAVSCYQNLTGIPFGKKSNKKNFDEKVVDIRTKTLGLEIKKRFIFGAYCTNSQNYENIFLKSKKIRTLIIDECNLIFMNCDFIISLGASDIAPLVKDVKSGIKYTNLCDDYLQIANFGGYPSITMPMIKLNNNFIGCNIMANINCDLELLKLSDSITKVWGKNND